MKKLIALSLFLGLTTGVANADVALGTTNAPGSPLILSAGATSGPTFLNVVSNDSPQDVMTAWNVALKIVAESGATGRVTFAGPAAGSPPNPTDYVFGGNGLGISVPTNTGSQLKANDYFDPNAGAGATVPAAPGANLLAITYSASADASGLFGVYALEGAGLTQWTDGDQATRFFGNVPDGTGLVLIGEVLIPQVVPEPSVLQLLQVGAVALAALRLGRPRR